MNLPSILLVWLLVGFVVGIALGKFCAVGSRSDARYLSKSEIEFDHLANNLTATKGSVDKAA